MPRMRIWLDVPHREFARIQKGSRAVEEFFPSGVDGFTIPHAEGYLILVRKNAAHPKEIVLHQLSHIILHEVSHKQGVGSNADT